MEEAGGLAVDFGALGVGEVGWRGGVGLAVVGLVSAVAEAGAVTGWWGSGGGGEIRLADLAEVEEERGNVRVL